MTKHILPSIRVLLVLTIITGIIYPLLMTGIGRIIFPYQANGSVISRNGKTIGSELIAQKFSAKKYFWPRPSAADYATVASGASNKGPTSADLQKIVFARRNTFAMMNGIKNLSDVPKDMIFASGSGLDPHISPEAARAQAGRIAAERKISPEQIFSLIEKITEGPQLGFLGEPRVNVLKLNLALDDMK